MGGHQQRGGGAIEVRLFPSVRKTPVRELVLIARAEQAPFRVESFFFCFFCGAAQKPCPAPELEV